MKILLLGGGAREHAIAWALNRSPKVEALFAAPGNPGIARFGRCFPIDPCDSAAVLDLVRATGADSVVAGPEAPLVAGVADVLREANVPVFGPGKDGAMLEGSKAFAKRFMERHGIPTAPFDIVFDMEQAEAALRKRTPPYVVKADGLAAGKGAFLPDTLEEALEICRRLLIEGELKEAGKTLVVEDFLPGTEITILAVTDGKTVRQLPSSQDHKRIFDGDRGPNTGGMGAYCPVPWADEDLLDRIQKQILEPTVRGLESEGIDFCGVIYAGLMIDSRRNCRVLEYNVRLGDPEAQVVLSAFPGDWAEVVEAACEKRLHRISWSRTEKTAVGVVLASGGYPGDYRKGYRILGIEEAEKEEGVLVFQAGTRLDSKGALVTSGGRVLTVVGIGNSLDAAREKAYGAASKIGFTDVFFRTDISAKACLPPWGTC
ncbi:MAG: phosphoribosylamine--glycine ligase [Synergistaceae bacterium]|nr:phosphoribosylamine--glycine ligase [Synergistaceae bacterium]